MAKVEIDELAKKYAFDIVTSPGTTCTVDAFLEALEQDKIHEGASVWAPFEHMTAADLFETFEMLADSHIGFFCETSDLGLE